MKGKYPTRIQIRERLLSNRTPLERIVLPPPKLSVFFIMCFLGTNLLAWTSLNSGTPISLYWSVCNGLLGGMLFAAFLIAAIQETILSRFQLFFLATVALFAGGIAGKWVGNTQSVFVLSSIAFTVISAFGMQVVFKEESKAEELFEAGSKPFWTRSAVFIAPFMFALATSTASFDSIFRSEALRFAILVIAGFTYVCLCPPTFLHLDPEKEIFYQLPTLVLAVGLGFGCIIGFTNLLVLLAITSSLLFFTVTRFSI